MSTTVANPVIYGKLLAKMQPHPIHSEQDYDRAIESITKLMERGEGNLSPEESSLLEMMSILVERYEQDHYPMESSNPAEMVHFLMEQRGLQQSDLARVLGSKSRVSEILNGNRNPSKEQAKRLATFFKVSPALFI